MQKVFQFKTGTKLIPNVKADNKFCFDEYKITERHNPENTSIYVGQFPCEEICYTIKDFLKTEYILTEQEIQEQFHIVI